MELFKNHFTESLLILFLLITFLQSAADKLLDWQGNLSWLKGHFSKSALKNTVPMLLGILVFMELITSVACVWGLYDLLANNRTDIALYAAVLSCTTLLMLLFGQRMAKDYDGARTIVIYFIPAILLLFFLEIGIL